MLAPSPTAGGPLLAWLLDALRPMNRTRVKQLLKHGRVWVNGLNITRHDHPLRPGDEVAIAHAVADRSLDAAGVSIVLEDDALIVLDKPPGLLTVATDAEKTDTAFARLRAHLAARKLGRPFVVHRLDRETSGLLLFTSGNCGAARPPSDELGRAVKKNDLAVVVEGKPQQGEGTVDNRLQRRRSRSKVVRKGSKVSQRQHIIAFSPAAARIRAIRN